MSSKTSRLLIAAGAALLLLAGGLVVKDLVEDYNAGRSAQLLLEQLREREAAAAQSADLATPTQAASTPAPEASGGQTPEPTPTQEPEDTQEPDYTEPPPLVYDVIGVLSIPQLGLQLPVISEYSDALLRVSVCRYKGDAQEKPDSLIVAGHSYKSHFGNLSKLAPGDKVYFTGLSWNEYCYSVTEVTVIEADDHAALESGEWDISLFTCTPDGSKRILVRCQEESEQS